MVRTKTATLKKPKNTIVAENQNDDENADPVVTKTKKPLEFDLPEEAAPLDDKIDDDAPAVNEETDELSSDESTLDDDELNPFGDKWEQ